MTAGIYEIVNTVNGKRYIGQSADITPRWTKHRSKLNLQKHPNRHLQSAWNTHGAEAFEFNILLVCAGTKEMLCLYEQQCLDALKPEYNICVAAESCLGVQRGPQTPEHIERRISPLRGRLRPPFSAEWLANMSQSQMGKGHPQTEATRAKLRAANTGKKRTPEQSAAQSHAQKGRKLKPFTPEHRAALSAAALGKAKSAAHRAALSVARRAREPAP